MADGTETLSAGGRSHLVRLARTGEGATAARLAWLVPHHHQFERARLQERDMTTWNATSDPARAVANRIERERLVSDRIARSARERGYTVLTVDGSRDLDAMEALVEESLGSAIEPGARAHPGDELRAIRRRLLNE